MSFYISSSEKSYVGCVCNCYTSVWWLFVLIVSFFVMTCAAVSFVCVTSLHRSRILPWNLSSWEGTKRLFRSLLLNGSWVTDVRGPVSYGLGVISNSFFCVSFFLGGKIRGCKIWFVDCKEARPEKIQCWFCFWCNWYSAMDPRRTCCFIQKNPLGIRKTSIPQNYSEEKSESCNWFSLLLHLRLVAEEKQLQKTQDSFHVLLVWNVDRNHVSFAKMVLCDEVVAMFPGPPKS